MNEKWWRAPIAAIAGGMVLITASTLLLLRGVEPFATWYYNFAWYPVLLIGDGVVALTGGAGRGKRGEFLLLGNGRFLITLLAWSSVVWLFYELFNFRLQNWYYVFLPEARVSRWSGTVIAFATVLPAVLVAEAILNGLRFGERLRWPRFTVTARLITFLRITGAIMLALVLIWPRWFFPLVWGATMLLVEPENYKRSRAHSLLADLEAGRPARVIRLLVGGACIGFIWELLNINARGKWIYTVPGIEELKIFEMPVPGFFGFPPFAVECFILWQALVLAGVAVPRWGRALYASRAKRIAAGAAAVAFSVGVLIGMEWLTIDSYTPRLSDLQQVPYARLASAGYDVFSLADASAVSLAAVTNTTVPTTERWIEQARLATLRGIGTEHLRLLEQVGVTSVHTLASQEPHALIASLEQARATYIPGARVRVWIRGAKRAVQQARTTS